MSSRSAVRRRARRGSWRPLHTYPAQASQTIWSADGKVSGLRMFIVYGGPQQMFQCVRCGEFHLCSRRNVDRCRAPLGIRRGAPI